MIKLRDLEKRLKAKEVECGKSLGSTINNMVAAGIVPYGDSYQRKIGFPEWEATIIEHFLSERKYDRASLSDYHCPPAFAPLFAIAQFRQLITAIERAPDLVGEFPEVLGEAWEALYHTGHISEGRYRMLFAKLRSYRLELRKTSAKRDVGRVLIRQLRHDVRSLEMDIEKDLGAEIQKLRS